MTIAPVFVGIDVSKSTLDVFDAAIGRGERIANASAPIAALIERWRGQNVLVVFEATGSYDRTLRHALAAAGLRFARVNPARARDFARAAGYLAKTDAVDARMLAAMGERLRPDASPPEDADRERLGVLHRRRDQLVLMRQQERTRARESSHEDEQQDIARHIAWLSAAIKDIERRIHALVVAAQALRQA